MRAYSKRGKAPWRGRHYRALVFRKKWRSYYSYTGLFVVRDRSAEGALTLEKGSSVP